MYDTHSNKNIRIQIFKSGYKDKHPIICDQSKHWRENTLKRSYLIRVGHSGYRGDAMQSDGRNGKRMRCIGHHIKGNRTIRLRGLEKYHYCIYIYHVCV